MAGTPDNRTPGESRPQGAEKVASPAINFRVNFFDENDKGPIAAPGFDLLVPMNWGLLRLEDYEGRPEEVYQYDKRRELRIKDGRLVDVMYYDPGLGVDVSELPLAEGQPTQAQLEAFFNENDIQLGRKTDYEIRLEYIIRSGRWLDDWKRNGGKPDFRHPDYVRLGQIGIPAVQLVLEDWRSSPKLPWRYFVSGMAHNIGSTEGVGDDFDPDGRRDLTDEQAHDVWVRWGLRKEILQPEDSLEGIIASFDRLAERLRWQKDPISPDQIPDHLDYQAILKAGKGVLPLIFDHLENHRFSRMWFDLLPMITGEDPSVGLDSSFKAKPWIAWAREQGELSHELGRQSVDSLREILEGANERDPRTGAFTDLLALVERDEAYKQDLEAARARVAAE